MNNNIQRIPLSNVKTRITYTGRKLGIKFQIKYLTKNQHNLIYYSKCPEPNCDKDYLGETGRRIIKRVADHFEKVKKSDLLNHALISNHPIADLKDLKIIDKNSMETSIRGRHQRLYTLNSTDQWWMHRSIQYNWNFWSERLILINVT